MQNSRRILCGTAVVVVCLAQSFAQKAQPDNIASLIESREPSDPDSLPDAPSADLAGARPGSQTDDGRQNSDRLISERFFANSSHSTYLPAKPQERFRLFLQHSCSPSALAGTIIDASRAQLQSDWPGYGHGLQGFGKRYGALLADRGASSFFGTFLLPSLLHQDPRYFRLGQKSSMRLRIGYALTRVGIARDNDGRNTLNSSLLLSTILSSSLANAYYPKQQRGLSETVRRTETSLLDHVQSNLSREFLPDLEHFLWKHLPARLKRIEKRMPLSRKWEPEGFGEE